MKTNCKKFVAIVAAAVTPLLVGQQAKRGSAGRPFQAKSSSTIAFNVKDGAEAIDITNVAYEVAGMDQRLLLRKTFRSKQVSDDVDIEASGAIEAWPLGVDPRQKPVYSITVPAVDARTVNNELLAISRGLAEVEWWSVHKIQTGEHLFDTYVPLVQFSIARDVQTLRYAGLETPPDDVSDARLNAPNVVGVLTYASAERVIREALITCTSAKQAALLRSFADATRTVAVVEHEVPAAAGRRPKAPARAIRISISQNYPSPAATVTVMVPVLGDDLDIARAQAPAGMRIVAWRR